MGTEHLDVVRYEIAELHPTLQYVFSVEDTDPGWVDVHEKATQALLKWFGLDVSGLIGSISILDIGEWRYEIVPWPSKAPVDIEGRPHYASHPTWVE